MPSDDEPPSVLRRFGRRLIHDTPDWVQPSNHFHIRLRVAPEQTKLLTDPKLAATLLSSARFYHNAARWWLGTLLLMPDHLHALIAFPQLDAMSRVIGDWKHWHSRRHGVRWQDGYFDHRIRDSGNGLTYEEKRAYILHNPVHAGLCAKPEDWPWKVDGALRRGIS